MSRVLLTGAGGFLGAPTLRALQRAGHEVHAVSRASAPEPQPQADGADAAPVVWHSADLPDPEAVQALVSAVRPQSLVHMAWYVEHGRYWHAPENLVWVEATLRLLRCFVDAGGQRAVMAGTCAEYQWSLDRYAEATAPLEPETLYGVAKDATRRVAERFAAGAGIELAWGRIFTPYGPAEGPGRLLASVIGSLLAGQPARAPLGTHVRDLMFVEDVAGAFAAILDSDVQGAVNVGSGQPTSIRELLALAGEAVGRPELLQWGALAQRESEPAQLVAEIARLREEVGFESQVSLAEGIERTVAWWRERVS